MLAEISADAEKEHVLQFDGTKFSIALRQPSEDGFWTTTAIRLQNEHLSYEDVGKYISLQAIIKIHLRQSTVLMPQARTRSYA